MIDEYVNCMAMTDYLLPAESPKVLTDRIVQRFNDELGCSPAFVALAPGRVNVIGEHVDYCGGWVLPAAIERYMAMAVRPRADGRVTLRTTYNDEVVEFSLDDLSPNGEGWSRYVKGVLAGMNEAGFVTQGFDAYVESTIPAGAGLSSSAALEAVTGLAALTLCGGEMDRFELAKLCQRAEHEYAGVPCGIMDQAAVLNCVEGNLLFLDCESEVIKQTAFEAPDWALLVINSGVSHELANSEYPLRRAACEKSAEVLGVSSLRHISLEGLDAALAHQGITNEMRPCIRHVVTENARTHRTVKALAEGDVATAGKLLNESHASLRDDYRVSCAELDFIAETAQSCVDVAGCRMTGGGFGGSCIALVRKDFATEVAAVVSKAYESKYGHHPDVFLTAPAKGAWVERLD